MTIRNQFSLIALTALLIGIAVFFFMRKKDHEGEKFMYAVPLKMGTGWGYKIYLSKEGSQDTLTGKLYIKQEYVPGIPGRHVFTSASDAQRVGNLVIWKISSGYQPIIAATEIDSLGIEVK